MSDFDKAVIRAYGVMREGGFVNSIGEVPDIAPVLAVLRGLEGQA